LEEIFARLGRVSSGVFQFQPLAIRLMHGDLPDVKFADNFS
jgi:hypothetical protein